MPAPKGNQSGERHGLYRLDRVRREIGLPLDRRTRESKLIEQDQNSIARDRGYRDWAEMPTIPAKLARAFAYLGLQIEIVIAIPPEQRTERQREDLKDWVKIMVAISKVIGIDRVPRDVTDIARELAHVGREAQ